ncbi:MAG: hypothetical protein ABFD94_16090, partial [Armatimonadia bacterium]
LAGAVSSALTGLALISLPAFIRYPDPKAPGELIAIAKSPLIPLAGALAIVVPLIVMPIVSSLTKKLPAEHVERVFAADQVEEEDEPTVAVAQTGS